MHKENKSDEKTDSLAGESEVIPGRLGIIAVIVTVWGVVFAAIYFAQPLWYGATNLTNYVADKLDVSLGVLIAAILSSTYLSAAVVFAANPSTRAWFNIFARKVLGSEKSFHNIYKDRFENISTEFISAADIKPSNILSMRSRLDRIEEEYLGSIDRNFDTGEWEEAQSRAAEIAMEKLSEGAIERIRKSVAQSRVFELEEISLARLSDQIAALGYRANISLVTGVGFCVVGLLILWSTLSNVDFEISMASSTGVYWGEFLKVYAPRLSIVLIIEIIGFFFLKLFRTALDEIRLTQNEATNVELKLIGSNLATSECKSELPGVIQALLETERNSVIEKGQTTVDLEKAKAWQASDVDLIDKLRSLIKVKP